MSNVIEKSLNYLTDNGYINYDSIIPKEILERVLLVKLDLDNNDPRFWESCGKFLALKGAIEKKGYFTTQRGYEKSLYIIPIKDMGKHADKICRKIKDKQKLALKIMQEADSSLLSKEESDNHFHNINRLVMLSRATKSILRKSNKKITGSCL